MTKAEIREKALYWIGAEAGDGAEFAPHLDDAIEEGYGRMRIAAGEDWPEPMGDADSPDLPAWAHSALADFAAYMALRDGGADRRQRAAAHYTRYYQAESRLQMREGKRIRFRNLY